MTHPFLHSGLPISCSQQGIYCRIAASTHTRTHKWDFSTFRTAPFLRSLFFHIPSSLHSIFSLSPWQEAPQDNECAWSRNDRTMGSRLSPKLCTHIQCTHTPAEEELEGEGAMEKWGALVTGTSCFHIKSSHPYHRGVWRIHHFL